MSEEAPEVKPVVKKAVIKKSKALDVDAPAPVEEAPAPAEGYVANAEDQHPNIPQQVQVKNELIRLAGKNYYLPVFQVVNYPEGTVLYDDKGFRASPPVTGEEATRVRKVLSRTNDLLRKKYHPTELREAVGR